MTPFAPVAERLGMRLHQKRWGPCPACGAKSTGRENRPPVATYLRGERWRCNACQADGDAYNLISWSIGLLGVTRGRAWGAVQRWLQEAGEIPQVAEVYEPLVRIDPFPALKWAKPLLKVSDRGLDEWLRKRGISPSAPAGWLPDFTADWWPGYCRDWPVVIPACTGRGEVVSMHGIAISADAPHKTTWPKSASAKELLFAAPTMRAVLAGKAPPPDRILIVEGATDFLTAAPSIPTLGITPGSPAALRTVKFSPHTKLYFSRDLDDKMGKHGPPGAGHRYENEVANAVAPHPLRVLPLERVARTTPDPTHEGRERREEERR